MLHPHSPPPPEATTPRLRLLMLASPGCDLQARLRPIADLVVVLSVTGAQHWAARDRFDAVITAQPNAAASRRLGPELFRLGLPVVCVLPFDQDLPAVSHGPVYVRRTAALPNRLISLLRREA